MKTPDQKKADLSPQKESASAWAPGHITGFFEISDDADDILHRGSRGAGISLASGCSTHVAIHDHDKHVGDQIATINGQTSADWFPVSRKVIDLFHNKTRFSIPRQLDVSHDSLLPAGAGFGSSGAGVLSLSLALNALAGFPMSQTDAAAIAHEAEVLCGTGLGTVAGDMAAGLEARIKPGAPGIGRLHAFPQAPGLLVIACIFGPLSTKQALADPVTRRRINEAGGKCLAAFLKDPAWPNLMKLSREFAENTGLISLDARAILDLLDRENISGSMTMFGDAVYAIADTASNKDARGCILELFARAKEPHSLFESEIAAKGAYVIDETRHP